MCASLNQDMYTINQEMYAPAPPLQATPTWAGEASAK